MKDEEIKTDCIDGYVRYGDGGYGYNGIGSVLPTYGYDYLSVYHVVSMGYHLCN